MPLILVTIFNRRLRRTWQSLVFRLYRTKPIYRNSTRAYRILYLNYRRHYGSYLGGQRGEDYACSDKERIYAPDRTRRIKSKRFENVSNFATQMCGILNIFVPILHFSMKIWFRTFQLIPHNSITIVNKWNDSLLFNLCTMMIMIILLRSFIAL